VPGIGSTDGKWAMAMASLPLCGSFASALLICAKV